MNKTATQSTKVNNTTKIGLHISLDKILLRYDFDKKGQCL